MCGIVGAVGPDAKRNAQLAAHCSLLSHRGPDGEGLWHSVDGEVALGHRRLAIVDLSDAGAQPMTDESGHLTVVLNGEIYNHHSLRSRLKEMGHRFRSASDTEVLLEAYRKWGVDCLEHLNGMFAFALYDARNKTLFLARDRAGEKPLFYSHAAGRLTFASEMKALLADDSISRRLNSEALDHYLAYGYVPGELCMIEGFRKLPPGHAAIFGVDSGTLRIWRYWSLPAAPQGTVANEEELLSDLEALLEDAVRMQLAADVPVGVLLSGGVDSSLITAMASRVSSADVRTFTVSFPGHGSYDEGPYAKIVASHFGTRHTELRAEPASLDILTLLARQFDEPIGDSSIVPTFLVSRLIREMCTVAVGGDGGDELFGGYVQYSRVQRLMRVQRFMPSAVGCLVGTGAAMMPVGVRGRSYLRLFGLPENVALSEASLHFDLAARRRLAPMTHSGVTETPEAYRIRAASGNTIVQRMTSADFATYLPDDILVKVDRASMLTSLEVRAPFLDHRIIEFAFSRVPDHMRATPDAQKVLLKKLAKRLLPGNLDIQRKQGFSIPLNRWFKGEWGTYLRDVLRSAPSALYNRRAIEVLLRGQAKGLGDAQKLFNLAMLELWRREYKVEL